MRQKKHSTSHTGSVPFFCVMMVGTLLFSYTVASAKMSNAPPQAPQQQVIQTTMDRRSPSFVMDFESRMRPFLESKLKGGVALLQLPQTQHPRETDFLQLVSLWSRLSPAFKALYKAATQVPAAFNRYISPGGHFEVYYLPLISDGINGVAVIDTISYGGAGDWRPRLPIPNGIPDYVDEVAWALDSSWSMEVDRFNFIAPLAHKDNVHTSDRYPVVIRLLDAGTYGLTYPDTAPIGPKSYPSYLELRNNWNGAPWTGMGYDLHPENGVRVTCAHELFHGVQYAMTWNVVGMINLDNFPLTWIEGSAVLMEELGFDYINDYLQYSGDFFNDPGMSFFDYLPPSDMRIYSNSLLVKYLFEKTAGPQRIDFVRNILFNNYAVMVPFYPNLRAASLSSGSSWTAVLNRFHTASYYTGLRADSSRFLADAGIMGTWGYTHDVPSSSFSVTKQVNPYGMRVFSFAPDSADEDTAGFVLQCGTTNQDTVPFPSWAASCIVRGKTGPDTILPLTIDTSCRAAWRLPGWKSKNDILIVVSNGAPSETRNAAVYFTHCPITYHQGDTQTFRVAAPDSQSSLAVALAANNDLVCSLFVDIADPSSYNLPSSKPLLSSLFRIMFPSFWGNDASVSGTVLVRIPHIAALRKENSIANDSIRVLRWNAPSSSWEKAAGTAAPVDTISWRSWRITAVQPGTYGIFASGYAALVIFPNPGRLRAGKFIRFEGNDIQEIRIYSIDGELVASSADQAFRHYNSGCMWQLVNSHGKAVVPGCYRAAITRNGPATGGKKEATLHKLLVFP